MHVCVSMFVCVCVGTMRGLCESLVCTLSIFILYWQVRGVGSTEQQLLGPVSEDSDDSSDRAVSSLL